MIGDAEEFGPGLADDDDGLECDEIKRSIFSIDEDDHFYESWLSDGALEGSFAEEGP